MEELPRDIRMEKSESLDGSGWHVLTVAYNPRNIDHLRRVENAMIALQPKRGDEDAPPSTPETPLDLLRRRQHRYQMMMRLGRLSAEQADALLDDDLIEFRRFGAKSIEELHALLESTDATA